MSRNNILLASINKEGRGLEVGPSHRPAAPRREGYQVEIIDHLDREGLLAKYRDHNLDLDAIEEVDYIWSGQSYAELTGKTDHYDWIIASHVIEHTPDEGDCDFIHTLEQAADGMKKAWQHKAYIDCHVWCFVPHSFRLLIEDLHSLGLISLREVSFTQTRGSEFFVTLGRHGAGMDVTRIEAAKQIELEVARPLLEAA